MRLFIKLGLAFIAAAILNVIISVTAYAFDMSFAEAGVMFLLAVYALDKVDVEFHDEKEAD